MINFIVFLHTISILFIVLGVILMDKRLDSEILELKEFLINISLLQLVDEGIIEKIKEENDV